MNKRIIIGLIISTMVLLLTPVLPIVQFSEAKEAQERSIYENIGQTIINSLQSDQLLSDSIPQGIMNLIVTILTKNSFIQKFIEGIDDSNGGDDPQPLFFPFLGIFVYGLIAFIIIKIILYILQYFGSIIRGIANNIATRISNIIQSIGNLVLMIVTAILSLITGIFNGVVALGEFIITALIILIQKIFTLIVIIGQVIITVITAILSAIVAVILLLLNILVFILQRIWQGFGTFIGLMLDIFRLIYETIFPPNAIAN